MDGVFGEYILGNIETLHNKDKRNKMPYNCNHIKRIEINIDSQEVIAFNELPMIDDNGNTHYIELASIDSKKWGNNACYAYGISYHITIKQPIWYFPTICLIFARVAGLLYFSHEA